jgi:hypothetical protein
MWKDAYLEFRENAQTSSGNAILSLRDSLFQVQALKGRGMGLSVLVKSEITKGVDHTSPQVQQEFGALLHLVHRQLQQIRSGSS